MRPIAPASRAQPSTTAAAAVRGATMDLDAGPEGAEQLHVQVRDGSGKPAWLLLDTGSQGTYLYRPDLPDGTANVGTVNVAGQKMSLMGRNEQKPYPLNGSTVIGTLGTDQLLKGPTELDLKNGRIAWYSKLPDGVKSWPTVPFKNVNGFMVVNVNVDGTPLKLEVDTGSPHVLWYGAQGRPGDTQSAVEDVNGTDLPMFIGPSQVKLAGQPAQQLSVERVPKWDYFAQIAKDNGVQGLAGLNLFGRRRVIVDAKAGVLRLGPE
jgi:hypothetical protein